MTLKGLEIDRQMTVEEFLVKNPGFIKLIISGSVLGVLAAVGEDPKEYSELVDDTITAMLTQPAVNVFEGEGNGS